MLLNYFSVLCFGVLLTLAFAGIPLRGNVRQAAGIIAAFGLLQAGAYLLLGAPALYRLYPLLTHAPLFFLLRYRFQKTACFAGIAVLSAYLFCTPRKWAGTAVSCFWAYDSDISYLVQVLVTLPLLLLILRFVAPSVAQLEQESSRILRFFLAVPLLYYILEYSVTVYTDLLYDGGAAVVEFMDSAVVTLYFLFSILYLKTLREKNEIELEHAILTMMSERYCKEVEALRRSEQQHAIYRHDLRHHMNYLNACIQEGRLQQAADYIRQTFAQIDSSKRERYSSNEALDLILSAYIEKAREQGVAVTVSVTAVEFARFQITDLCCLLGNALENAVRACAQMPEGGGAFIRLRMYEKSNKLCIRLVNSCAAEPVFAQGVPVSGQAGHGLGVKSIIHVVNKYGGVYGFSAGEGQFTLQVSL